MPIFTARNSSTTLRGLALVGIVLITGAAIGTGCFTSTELSCDPDSSEPNQCLSDQICNEDGRCVLASQSTDTSSSGDTESSFDADDSYGAVDTFGADSGDTAAPEDTSDTLRTDTEDTGRDGGELDGGGEESKCQDGKDNDGDGDTDCADSDCPDSLCCTFDPTENDRRDSDGSHDSGVCTNQPETSNGKCEEPSGYLATEQGDENAVSGIDDDCDGQTDEAAAGEGCGSDRDCSTGACADGVCVHQTFVSSVSYSGSFSSPAVSGAVTADLECQLLGEEVGSGRQQVWKAILSDGNGNAEERIDVEASVHRVDGILVESDPSSFFTDGLLENPIDMTEKGNTSSAAKAWSGTFFTGSPPAAKTSSNCSNWSDDSDNFEGRTGEIGDTDLSWLNSGSDFCNNSHPIYCINGQ